LRANIIRPRDAIRSAVSSEPRLHVLFAPINELGWVSDGALGLAVRMAVAHLPVGAHTVILENLPGDAFQVADVEFLARQRGGRLIVLQLDAPDKILVDRGSNRRVCRTCERDHAPHEPARPAENDRTTCGSCGDTLRLREDDERNILSDRTARHRQYLQGVLKTIEALDIPLIRIDTSTDRSTVESAALDAISPLTSLVDTLR
jgi:adenylate kinase family enzyme